MQIDKEDNLPKQLCQQCHTILTHCQEFFNKCKKSEETLRAILIKNEEHITIKMEEIDVPLEQEVIVEDVLEGVCDGATTQDVHQSRENRKNVKPARSIRFEY